MCSRCSTPATPRLRYQRTNALKRAARASRTETRFRRRARARLYGYRCVLRFFPGSVAVVVGGVCLRNRASVVCSRYSVATEVLLLIYRSA